MCRETDKTGLARVSLSSSHEIVDRGVELAMRMLLERGRLTDCDDYNWFLLVYEEGTNLPGGKVPKNKD